MLRLLEDKNRMKICKASLKQYVGMTTDGQNGKVLSSNNSQI